MSLAMTVSRYGGGGGGFAARGAYGFGPPAGTTTYGGAGTMRVPGGGLIGPGGIPMGPAGDPGFFSFIGKAAKGITGLVSKLGIPIVSGVAGAVSGLLPGGAQGPGITPMPLGLTRFGQGRLGFQGIPAPGIAGAAQRAFPGGATGMQACPTGYRPNKSGYYVQGAGGGQGQYVEPNTVCVKRRRMNPLNPRALSKAMRRIESAKRATTVLGRITIRKKCP